MTRSKRSFGRLRKLPSGRWQAAYTGPDATLHRAPTTFLTDGDAQAWLTDRSREISRGEWSGERAAKSTKAVLFGEYSTAWLADRTLKPRTRALYASLLKNQINPTFEKVALKAITPHTIRTWHTGLGTGAPTQRSHAYALLRSILGDAVHDGEIIANPAHIRGAGTSTRVHKIKPATLAELEVLTASMLPKYRLMVLLAAWCGLRFGELTELRRKDIAVGSGVIHVRRGVVYVKGGYDVGTPKSVAGTRDVNIPPHLHDMVTAHLEDHVATGKDGLLFPAADGVTHLAPSTLYKTFYKAREKAGRPDLRFHDLRHTGAVLAASTGATLAELMARLGHSTPAAALRYQHAAEDRDKVIAAALSALASGNATS
jgi:integrase